MKLKKFVLPSILLGFAFTFALAITPLFESTNAAFMEETYVSEDFNKKALDGDKWVMQGVNLNSNYGSLRFTPTIYDWGGHVINKKYQLDNSNVIDIEIAEQNLDGWFGISFGTTTITSIFSDARFGFIFYDANADFGGSTLERNANNVLTDTQNFQFTPFHGINVHKILRIYTSYNASSNYTSIYFDVLNLDYSVYSEHTQTYSYFGIPGYVGFNTSFKNAEIYKYTVYSNPEMQIVYQDDFKNASMQYLSGGEGDWSAVTPSFDENAVKCSPVGNLVLNSGNSSLIYSLKYNSSSSEDLDIAYEITATVDYSSSDKNTLSGFEIARKSVSEEGYFFGIQPNNVGYTLQAYGPGQTNPVTAVSLIDEPNNTADLMLVVRNNGKILFKTSSCSLEYYLNDITGFFGLGSRTTNGGLKGATIDDFVFEVYKDVDTSYSDVSQNFEGIIEKTTTSGETTKSFYYPTKEWKASNDTELSRYINYKYEFNTKAELDAYDTSSLKKDQYARVKADETQSNQVAYYKWGGKSNPKWVYSGDGQGYLKFNKASNSSYFGSNNKYSEYIVRFDVTFFDRPSVASEHSGFALTVGQNKFGTLYDNTQSLGIFQHIDSASGNRFTIVDAKNSDFVAPYSDDLRDEDGNRFNMFDLYNEKDPTYNFMFVVRDGKIAMYFKRASEPESKLASPRSVVTVRGSTYGYCTINGVQAANFAIDNFSLTNLDYKVGSASYAAYIEGEKNIQVTTRSDFIKDTSAVGFNFTNASINNEKLRIIDGGTVETVGVCDNGITRIKFNSIEDYATVRLGEVEIKFTENSDLKKHTLTLKDKANTYEVNLGSEFSYKNAIFEISKEAGNISISYVSGDAPLAAILFNKETYQLNTGVDEYKVTISSSGITNISALTYMNLNSKAYITKRDYDPEKDKVIVWTFRQTVEEYNAHSIISSSGSTSGTSVTPGSSSQGGGGSGGCGGSITAASVITLLFVPIVTVSLIRKSKEDR